MWRGTSYSTLLHGTVILLLLFGLPSLPLIFKRDPEKPTSVARFAPGTVSDQGRRGVSIIPSERPDDPQDRPAGATGIEPRAIEVILVPAGELPAAQAPRRKIDSGPVSNAVLVDGNEPPPEERRDPRRTREAVPSRPETPPRRPGDASLNRPSPRAPTPQPRDVSRPTEPVAAALSALARHDDRIGRAVRGPDPTPPSPAGAARQQRNFERVEKAASEGYVNAQFNLAVMMQQGVGTPPNPETAAKWLERAAERGHLRAQILLAYNAIAAPPANRDLARADFWLSIAEQRNSRAAREARALLKPRLSLDDEMRARRMRADWRRMMAMLAPVMAGDSYQNKVDEELREAAEKGDIDGVLNALLRGADAASRDRFGRNAIINAAWRGRENIVRLMLERGIDIEAADNRGRTPVNWAAINGHRRVVEMLLDGGADPDRIDSEGTTALIRAAWNGHDAVVERLIAAGARLDTRDPKGRTALDRARQAGQTGVIRRLEAALEKSGKRPPASGRP